MVATLVGNLSLLKPTEQRRMVVGLPRTEPTTTTVGAVASSPAADPETTEPLV
jgi:hypothetical protein